MSFVSEIERVGYESTQINKSIQEKSEKKSLWTMHLQFNNT